jgi:glutamate-1-semialdehyde 2,1-aminomutase
VRIKAILFDLHNTLVYANEVVSEVELSEYLFSKGYEISSQALRAAWSFVSFVDYPKHGYPDWHSFFSRIFWRLSVGVDRETIDEVIKLLEDKPYQLYPDAASAVKEAKKSGFKTAIVTTIARFKFEKAIQPISKHIDFVMTGYEAGCDKSNPKMYLRVLEVLGVEPEEAVMIGDDIQLDVRLPKSLGMGAILLDREMKNRDQSVDAFVYNLNQAVETIIRQHSEDEVARGTEVTEKYVSKTYKSKSLYERAKKVLPAGVSYGIRYFEPYPFYTSKAKGCKLYDVDGNEYIDFWLGHTALILGHSPPAIVKAVGKQLENGTQYGTSHELEVEVAEQVVKMVPSAEMIRFTNSGTEANMYATRLARAYTGKNCIAKFEGGWHGGYDALQIGVRQPFNVPESAGLTEGATNDTILLPFNDLEGVKNELREKEIASILVEPVLGSGGGVPANKEFLKGLRELCDEKNILLIFDEVITGFRLAPGGGQQYYGVTPDITVLGKILGGGFPIGAFCGRKEIMERINSLVHKRPDYSFHGGTFAANPITMVAGLTTLRTLESGELIDGLNRLGHKTREQLSEIFETGDIDAQVIGAGSIFNVHFTKEEVIDAHVASRADKSKLFDYHLKLIADGIFMLPTHNGALSAAHTNAEMERLFSETEDYARHANSS